MRILFLTQWFQPESFFKGLPFAKALNARGHDVEVLTGFPNYPEGKLYPGYHVRFYQREIMSDITVHRVPLYPSHDKSALRRILNYLSFSLSAFFLGPFLVKKPDVIYVYNLITLGPPAFLLRFLYGAKVIIDVQDLWPESVANSGMLRNSISLRILSGICNWVYTGADHVTVLSPGFKENMIRRGAVPEKIDVIYNWCEEVGGGVSGTLHDLSKGTEYAEKFIVLFAGSMGTVQGLDTVLACASLCSKSLPDVLFVLIGGGVDRPRLQQRAAELGLANVVFLPPRPVEEMGEIYSIADVLLVHLKDDPLFRITIPSKTQAYLYKGKPIIMAMNGDAAALVRSAGAGIVCEPDKPQEMMKAVSMLRDTPINERQAMGESGHRFYMERLSFEKGVDQFEQIMKSLVKKAA